MWIILGDHFWMDSVLSSFWFDSGYIFLSVNGVTGI